MIITTSDEKYYPNPDVFDPDRFTEEARKDRHKAHYLPFGEGKLEWIEIVWM